MRRHACSRLFIKKGPVNFIKKKPLLIFTAARRPPRDSASARCRKFGFRNSRGRNAALPPSRAAAKGHFRGVGRRFFRGIRARNRLRLPPRRPRNGPRADSGGARPPNGRGCRRARRIFGSGGPKNGRRATARAPSGGTAVKLIAGISMG